MLGRPLILRATSAAALGLAAQRFAGFAEQLPEARPIELQVVDRPAGEGSRVGLELGRAPGPAPAIATSAQEPARHRERGPRYLAACGASLALAELDARRILVFLDPADARESCLEVLLASPVWRCLAWEGLVALHGAALRLGDRAWLLRGASGAGKSCLALAAALAGRPVLAEEACWLDPRPDGPLLRGELRHFRLDPRALERLPALAGARHRARPAGAGEVAIDAGSAAPGAWVEAAPAAGAIFLERQSEPGAVPALERLDPARARRGFAATANAGESTQDGRRLRAARERVLEQGAWRLRYRSLEEALALLERLA